MFAMQSEGGEKKIIFTNKPINQQTNYSADDP